MLYKSDSGKAHELMSSDPAVFSDVGLSTYRAATSANMIIVPHWLPSPSRVLAHKPCLTLHLYSFFLPDQNRDR